MQNFLDITNGSEAVTRNKSMHQPVCIQTNVSLLPYTTLRIGGSASFFADVKTKTELESCVRWANAKSLPITIIGGGSNILVSDSGVEGMVLRVGLEGKKYHDETDDTALLTIAAGELLDSAIAETVARQLWGLENLSHIPGTIGAVPVQNVGAYGVEAQDVIESVEVFDLEKETYGTLSNEACAFGYRDSYFKKATVPLVITSVTFALSKKPKPQLDYKELKERFGESTDVQLAAIRNAIIEIRNGKFPDWTKVGTAGSFFKNPIITDEVLMSLRKSFPEIPSYPITGTTYKIPAAFLLDKVVQRKGFRIGDVGLFENQAIVLVNYGQASANDVISFANQITDEVRNATNITLEWEVRMLS